MVLNGCFYGHNKLNGSMEKKGNKPFNGILVFVAYAQKPPSNTYADIFSGTRSLIYFTLVQITKIFEPKCKYFLTHQF